MHSFSVTFAHRHRQGDRCRGASAPPRVRVPSNVAQLNIVLLRAFCIINAPEYAISDKRTLKLSGERAQLCGGAVFSV